MSPYTFACICIQMLALSSCARAGGSSLVAQEVNAPTSDLRCFAILQDGKAVGGNCLSRP